MARLALASLLALACVAGAVAQCSDKQGNQFSPCEPGSVLSAIVGDKAQRFTLWAQIVKSAATSRTGYGRGLFDLAPNDNTNLWFRVVTPATPGGGRKSPAGTYLVPTDEGVQSTLELLGLSFEQIVASATACERLLKFHSSTVVRNFNDLQKRTRVNNPDLPTWLNNQPTGYVSPFAARPGNSVPQLVLPGFAACGAGGCAAAPPADTTYQVKTSAPASLPVSPLATPGPNGGPSPAVGLMTTAASPADPGSYFLNTIRPGANALPKFQGTPYTTPTGDTVDVVATLVKPSGAVGSWFINDAAFTLGRAAVNGRAGPNDFYTNTINAAFSNVFNPTAAEPDYPVPWGGALTIAAMPATPAANVAFFAVHVIDSMLLPPIPSGTAPPSYPTAAATPASDQFFNVFEALAFTPGSLQSMQVFNSPSVRTSLMYDITVTGTTALTGGVGLGLDTPMRQRQGVTMFVPTDAAWSQFLAATNVDLPALISPTANILSPQAQFLSAIVQAHFFILNSANSAVPVDNVQTQIPPGTQAGVRYSADSDAKCYAAGGPNTCQFPVLSTGLQIYPGNGFTAFNPAAGYTPAFGPTLEIVRQVTPGQAAVTQVLAYNSTSSISNTYKNIVAGYPNFAPLGTVVPAGTPRQQQPPYMLHMVDQVIFPDVSYRMRSALEAVAVQASPATGAAVTSQAFTMKALQATGMDELFYTIQNATLFLPLDSAWTNFVNNPDVRAFFPWGGAATVVERLNGLLDDTTTLNKILSYHILAFGALDWRNVTARKDFWGYPDSFRAIRPTCFVATTADFGAPVPLPASPASCRATSRPYPTLLTGGVLDVELVPWGANLASPGLVDITNPDTLQYRSYKPVVLGDNIEQNAAYISGNFHGITMTNPLSPMPLLSFPNDFKTPPTWYAFDAIYQINSVIIPDFSEPFATIAANPDLQSFEEAISAAGLEATFSALREVQVYAPNNLAFDKYLNKIGKTFDQVKADTLNLINLLNYHVVEQYAPMVDCRTAPNNVIYGAPAPVATPATAAAGCVAGTTFAMVSNDYRNPNTFGGCPAGGCKSCDPLTNWNCGSAAGITTVPFLTSLPTALVGASLTVLRSTQTINPGAAVPIQQPVITLQGNAPKPLDSVATIVTTVPAAAPAGTAGIIMNIAPTPNQFAHWQMFVIDGVLIPNVNTASITDVLLAQPDLTTFVQAYIAAGFQNMFENLDGVTVFAPNNNAFAVLLANLKISLADLLANKNLLVQILSNHVVVGCSPAAARNSAPARTGTEASWSVSSLSQQFNNNLQLFTMWNPPASSYADGKSNTLTVGSLNPPTMVSSSIPNSRAVIRTQDLVASNSYIHIVDSVLLPK